MWIDYTLEFKYSLKSFFFVRFVCASHFIISKINTPKIAILGYMFCFTYGRVKEEIHRNLSESVMVLKDPKQLENINSDVLWLRQRRNGPIWS